MRVSIERMMWLKNLATLGLLASALLEMMLFLFLFSLYLTLIRGAIN